MRQLLVLVLLALLAAGLVVLLEGARDPQAGGGAASATAAEEPDAATPGSAELVAPEDPGANAFTSSEGRSAVAAAPPGALEEGAQRE